MLWLLNSIDHKNHLFGYRIWNFIVLQVGKVIDEKLSSQEKGNYSKGCILFKLGPAPHGVLPSVKELFNPWHTCSA